MQVPLSLYVHLPWCVKKCPYCDFNSHPALGDPPRARYLAALCRDLEGEAARTGGRMLGSIFLGGGTPSLFSGEEIGELLAAVRCRFDLVPDVEITLEVNPGTAERDNLAGYRAAGVNRLSLGVQSFDDPSLARLGRIHQAADSVQAFADARRAGFDNVNLDLMYALPAQSTAKALADIEQALALGAEHVSWYQLTLEPNTVFHHRPPADLPDEDACERMFTAGTERLRAAGYEQYEVSAFAWPGRRCRHNLNYWSFGDYLAVGAGAHGKVSDATGRIWRYSKPAHPLMYMQELERGLPAAAPLEESAALQLTAEDIAFEFLLNALRLLDGFSAAAFHARTGLSFERIRTDVEAATADGLLEQPAAGHYRPSPRGLRFLNDLQARFLPPAAGA